jgi:hypothetical protein
MRTSRSATRLLRSPGNPAMAAGPAPALPLLAGRGMRALFPLLMLAACTDLETRGETASSLDNPAIELVGGDQWSRSVGCPSPDPSTCLHEVSFWVDLAIRNDAYDKQVGVVWIDRVREDLSGTWHVAAAHYEGTRADGYEIWGADVAMRVIGGNEPRPIVQLAAFVEMAGHTHWDNNGGADYVLD